MMSRADVLRAIETNDWERLRVLSLQPGGLAAARVEAWQHVLSTFPFKTPAGTDKEVLLPHADERQVKLDTDRSFVVYPVESQARKESRQVRLNNTILHVLRRHPALGYFQGYHDIISVLLLTIDPDDVGKPEDIAMLQVCAEKISLHRLRDSMGIGMSPLIGQLRVLRRLIRLADQPFSESLERLTPLPYFALSNLLTLFSHEIPTLQLIQHVFDFLFTRPPIAVIYLAASIILSLKPEAHKLEEEGDGGMMHSLLARIPELEDEYDAEDSSPESPPPSYEETASAERPQFEAASIPNEPFKQDLPADEDASLIELNSRQTTLVDADDTLVASELLDSSLNDGLAPTAKIIDTDKMLHPSAETDGTTLETQAPLATPPSPLRSASLAPPSLPSAAPLSPQPSPSSSLHSPTSSSTNSDEKPRSTRAISLSSLLRHADELYIRYPPFTSSSIPSNEDAQSTSEKIISDTTNCLKAEEILGPSSVTRTWSEKPTLSDSEAEEIVRLGMHDVVFDSDGSSDIDYDERDEKWEKDRQRDANMDRERAMEKERERRRRAVMVTSVGSVGVAVFVGLAAVVLYSVERGNGGGGVRRELQDWSRTIGWVLGGVLGAGERFLGAPGLGI